MTGRHPPLRYPSSSRGEVSAPVILALAALFLVGVMAVLALIYVRRSMEQRAQAESARMEAERRRQIELQKAYETQMAAMAAPPPASAPPAATGGAASPPAGAAEVKLAGAVEEFLREHTRPSGSTSMLPGTPVAQEEMIPDGTRLLAATIRGSEATFDFSTELLQRREDPEFFDHFQMALINRIERVDPSLREFHFRIADSDGTMRDLSHYLAVSPERRPRQEPPAPVEEGR